MNEVKPPKRPLIFYYLIVLAVMLLFNMLVMPSIMNQRVQEVTYDVFMKMTDAKQIAQVQVEDSQISLPTRTIRRFSKPGGLTILALPSGCTTAERSSAPSFRNRLRLLSVSCSHGCCRLRSSRFLATG